MRSIPVRWAVLIERDRQTQRHRRGARRVGTKGTSAAGRVARRDGGWNRIVEGKLLELASSEHRTDGHLDRGDDLRGTVDLPVHRAASPGQAQLDRRPADAEPIDARRWPDGGRGSARPLRRRRARRSPAGLPPGGPVHADGPLVSALANSVANGGTTDRPARTNRSAPPMMASRSGGIGNGTAIASHPFGAGREWSTGTRPRRWQSAVRSVVTRSRLRHLRPGRDDDVADLDRGGSSRCRRAR